MTTRYPVAFYNVGPIGKDGRGPAVLERELDALRRDGRKVITLAETYGWGELPDLLGMDKIRDTSTPGRGNLTAYISKRLKFEPGSERWHKRKTTWQRTERPGTHPAREDLELTIDGGQWGLWHQPPRGIKAPRPPHDWITDEAQQEGIDLWAGRMAPWLRDDWDDRSPESQKRARDKLRVLLGDPNRDPQAPIKEPGPHQLADTIGGWVSGTNIEGGVIRGGHFVSDRKQARVGAVVLGSDHHGAYLATVVKD